MVGAVIDVSLWLGVHRSIDLQSQPSLVLRVGHCLVLIDNQENNKVASEEEARAWIRYTEALPETAQA